MSIQMLGLDVVKAIKKEMEPKVEALLKKKITPTLAIVRVGDKPDDIAYQKAAVKRCESFGITTYIKEFKEDVNEKEFLEKLSETGTNKSIHGILLLKPLPSHLSEDKAKLLIPEEKDIDCLTSGNIAKVFASDDSGFAPCTPEAVMEMLKHYNIPIQGSNAVIIGRSMVVGKPLAMLMLKKNATVTICHTKTRNLEEIASKADILIAAAGRAKVIGKEFIKKNACVIDVGINMDENNKLCGDVDYEAVYEIAGHITPVPKGVGTVTTAILAKHVIEACQRSY